MRRGFQPPADLWVASGILVAGIFVAGMCDRPFGKIWESVSLGGAGLRDCGFYANIVGETRPYK